MAIERPVDASSSQSAKTIERIETKGAFGESVRVVLSDGSSFFVPASLFVSEDLYPGLVLAEDRMAALGRLGEVAAIEKKALDLLGQREHSRYQLTEKLKKRGYLPAEIAEALDRIAAEGYLDDRRFASLWLSSRLHRNPEGRSRLQAGLRACGVSREYAEEALSHLTEEEENRAMREAAIRLLRHAGVDSERLLRSLLRKGFPVRAAKRLCEELSVPQEADASDAPRTVD